MTAPSPTHHVVVTLPAEAAMVTATLVCLSYIREDGTRGYSVHTRGDEPMTSYLGLTLLAQDEIKSWGHSPRREDDE